MLIHPGSEEERRDEGRLGYQRARGRSDDQEEEWREEEGAAGKPWWTGTSREKNSKFAMVVAFAFQLGQNSEEWWFHDLCGP